MQRFLAFALVQRLLLIDLQGAAERIHRCLLRFRRLLAGVLERVSNVLQEVNHELAVERFARHLVQLGDGLLFRVGRFATRRQIADAEEVRLLRIHHRAQLSGHVRHQRAHFAFAAARVVLLEAFQRRMPLRDFRVILIEGVRVEDML